MNQLLALLVGPLPAALGCVYLLELPNGVEKSSNDLEVATQPPVQEQKQQRNQADNKENFQVRVPGVISLPAIAAPSTSELPAPSALAFIRRVAQVSLAATWERIDVAATRRRSCPAAINASGWQSAPVNCLGENARDFL